MSFNQYQYKDLLIRQADPYANAKYQIILDYLANHKSLKILNAGCGSGELSFLLAAAGHAVLGIDPSPEYIALANKNLPADLRDHCSFSVSSIEDLEPGNQFDCVIATDVLEHISDDAEAAKKLAVLTRPGGQLVITVPAMQSLFGYHDEQLGHWRRYSMRQLKNLIANTGLIKVKKTRYFGFTLIPVCLWYSRLRRQSYPLASLEESGRYSISKLVLLILLALERLIIPPFGTSLILHAESRLLDTLS